MANDALRLSIEFFRCFRVNVHGVLDDLRDVAERRREDLIPQSIFRALLTVLIGIGAGRDRYISSEFANI